jgi:hypothetical protein
MTRRARSPLTEALELGQRQVISAQMQDAVEEHRSVPGGQHEAIAVGPVGMSRIVAKEAREQHVGDRRHRHRQAGVSGACLLHGVHAEHADRVNAQAFKLCVA